MKLVSDQKVVPIRPVVRKRDKKPDERHCPHGGEMLICPDTQLVQCGLCDAWLSPFQALSVLTRNARKRLKEVEQRIWNSGSPAREEQASE